MSATMMMMWIACILVASSGAAGERSSREEARETGRGGIRKSGDRGREPVAAVWQGGLVRRDRLCLLRKRPKCRRREALARLEAGLRAKEWFVTGDILPELFADDFVFQDPDVRVEGARDYSEGVRRLFDSSSRAQIVNTTLAETDLPGIAAIATVTWRLSGRVNLGPVGLAIKPYIVYTDFHIRDADSLIVYQLDRFSIPPWDILLSAVAPWLPFLAPAAAPVEE